MKIPSMLKNQINVVGHYAKKGKFHNLNKQENATLVVSNTFHNLNKQENATLVISNKLAEQ